MFKDPAFMEKFNELKRRYEEDKKSHYKGNYYKLDRRSLDSPAYRPKHRR